jgi:formylglycine-generating enzyme required for sulfatase activity
MPNELSKKLFLKQNRIMLYKKIEKTMDLLVSDFSISQIRATNQNIENLKFNLLPKHLDLKEIMIKGNASLSNLAFDMIYCQKGSFYMGTSDCYLEHNRSDLFLDAKPMHKVEIPKNIWVGATNISVDLWYRVMGWYDEYDVLKDLVDTRETIANGMNWYDCIDFCNKLSILDSLTPCYKLKNPKRELENKNHITDAIVEFDGNANGYRLPFENEWEYVAKASMNYKYSGGDDLREIAILESNKDIAIRGKWIQMRKKKPNAWGVYDMTGGVFEWCYDTYDENEYKKRVNIDMAKASDFKRQVVKQNVVRGGSFYNSEFGLRVYYRDWIHPMNCKLWCGLRVFRNG